MNNICKKIPGVIPFMVSIFNTQNNHSICGGSVLTAKYVLTAFHCLKVKDRWPKLSVNINFFFSVKVFTLHFLKNYVIYSRFSETNIA